jgi:hypothetical protein
MRQSVQFALGLASILAMLWAPDAPAQGRAPSSALLRQIDALREEKASRTPAQRKIGSRLLYASKIHRGVGIARVIPTLRTSVEVATDGTTLVDLRADVTTAVLDEIEALGGTVIHSSPAYRSVRARLALEGVETLAGLPEVQSIRPAARAITHKVNTSEGDIAHAADAVRTAFGVDGTGIKIGVLSDGVSSLAARQASGDLPANVTVLPGQRDRPARGTRARRCWRSCTTWLREPNSSLPRRSPARHPLRTTSSRSATPAPTSSSTTWRTSPNRCSRTTTSPSP